MKTFDQISPKESPYQSDSSSQGTIGKKLKEGFYQVKFFSQQPRSEQRTKIEVGGVSRKEITDKVLGI